MKPVNKSYSIILVSAFILMAFLVFLFSDKINFERNNIPAEEGYPDNVLEGPITYIDLEPDLPVIKIRAEVFRIISNAGEMEKTIKIPSDIEMVYYNMDTNEQKELKLEELRINDFINVAVAESTYEEVLTRDVFTANQITRFIKSEEIEQ